MIKYPDIGSPWCAHYSNLKYLVALPPFIMQDSCLCNKIFMQFTKLIWNKAFLALL